MDKKILAVVLVRGVADASRKIEGTLNLLNLKQVNTCTIIDSRPSYIGSIKLCKDYITWGEINPATFKRLFEKKLNGELKEKKLTPQQLADKILKFETDFKKEGIRNVFHLNSPKKGYRHIKKPYPKGALGYRAEAINQLLARMLR
ncbi:uL30 family ribosomal protein [Candidatus Micrarchaeota archaeon]|nr:uL30 family ribosomal protein [Candidatus Micrarchaeota archaeon]